MKTQPFDREIAQAHLDSHPDAVLAIPIGSEGFDAWSVVPKWADQVSVMRLCYLSDTPPKQRDTITLLDVARKYAEPLFEAEMKQILEYEPEALDEMPAPPMPQRQQDPILSDILRRLGALSGGK
jgi:hypothetical protein